MIVHAIHTQFAFTALLFFFYLCAKFLNATCELTNNLRHVIVNIFFFLMITKQNLTHNDKNDDEDILERRDPKK